MNENLLVRLNHTEPDLRILDRELRWLKDILYLSPKDTDGKWNRAVTEIIGFQDSDGSFKLIDSYEIESDARVDFCHTPTYLCTAILMKAFLADPAFFAGRENTVLANALKMCCARGLTGHGYDDLNGQIEAMRIFNQADVSEFIRTYPDLCPEFTLMIYGIVDTYHSYIARNQFVFYWGENHEQDFKEITAAFPNETNIFVYGTLMSGQRNHEYYLPSMKPLARGEIEGYRMYDIGSFPGIIAGSGRIKGEIYRVSRSQLEAIDCLEGEGYLYIKTPVTIKTEADTDIQAYAYIYNRSVSGKKVIPYERQPYGSEKRVWYVSYGSNMLEERLAYYICGGTCPYNGREYAPCSDPTMPEISKQVTIPYDMYYSNYNRGSWKNSAVCFLDLSHPGMSYGRAYLITESQLAEIHQKEGKGQDWYPDCIRLADIDGFPAYTYAGRKEKTHEPFRRVSAEYSTILYKGMKEAYPDMDDSAIIWYLENCGK